MCAPRILYTMYLKRQPAAEVSPRGEENNSAAFEAFSLFSDCLESRLSDLKKDISDKT